MPPVTVPGTGARSLIGAQRKWAAAGNALFSTQAVVAAGSLDHVTTNDAAQFKSSDVGKTIVIPYAGVIDATKTIPKAHVTTIASYVSSSVVTLTAPAVTPNNVSYTVSGTPTVLGGFAVWGTPDTTALQNWLNDCSTQRKPGELEPGNYLTTAPLIWPHNCKIKGLGWGESVLLPGGSGGAPGFACIRYAGDAGGGAVNVVNGSMEDFEIDCRGLCESTYTTGTKAIYIVNFQDFRFENLYLHDSPATAFGCDFPVDSGIHRCKIVRGGRQVAELGGSAGGSCFGIGTGKNLYEAFDITNNVAEDGGFNNYFLEAQTTPNPLPRGYRVIGNYSLRGQYGFAENGTQGSIFALNQAYDATGANYRIFKAFTNRYGKEVEFVDNKSIGGATGLEVNSGDGHWTWSGGEIAYGTGTGVTITDTGTDAGVAPHPTNMRLIDVNIHDMAGRGVQVLGTSPPAAFGALSILGGRIANIGTVGTRRPAVGIDRPCDVVRVNGLRVTDDRASGSKGVSYGLELTALVGELTRLDNDFPTTGVNALGDGAYNLATAPTVDHFRALP